MALNEVDKVPPCGILAQQPIFRFTSTLYQNSQIIKVFNLLFLCLSSHSLSMLLIDIVDMLRQYVQLVPFVR